VPEKGKREEKVPSIVNSSSLVILPYNNLGYLCKIGICPPFLIFTWKGQAFKVYHAVVSIVAGIPLLLSPPSMMCLQLSSSSSYAHF
jgi:hypothetical protein